MSYSLKYKTLPELKVIIEYFEGEVNLNNLIEFQMDQMKDNSCCKEFNDLTDIRDAEFVVEKNDVRKYAEFVKMTDQMQGTRKIAIVANTPNQTAITMLYTTYTEELAITNKVFSTVEAAMKWLAIPEEKYGFVEDTLASLKTK